MIALPTDRLIALHLADKTILVGRAEPLTDGWIHLRSNDSSRLVNLAHVVFIDLNESREDPGQHIDAGVPRPRSKDIPVKVGSKAPGRPWSDEDLKQLSEGFLDHQQDGALADRFNRTRSQVRDLRQAFECNRGNVVEDQISPAATTWIARWRRVLSGR